MQYICNNCSKVHKNISNYVCDCGCVNPLPVDINYFEYFNIPYGFKIDLAKLTNIYHCLVMVYHPDAHVLGTESSKINALQHASYLNAGFNVLKNNLQRFAYCFEVFHKQKIINEEVLHNSSIANEFFKLYDRLDSLTSVTECTSLAKDLQQHEVQILEQIEQLNFAEQALAKEIYIRLNYLQKIQQQLQAKQRLMANQ